MISCRDSRFGRRVVPALLMSAAIAMLVGASVYLLDRDWASVLFLAPFSKWQPGPGNWFGAVGGSLPSITHAFAIALLIIAALGNTARARLVGAASWFLVAGGLECLQSPGWRSLLGVSGGPPEGMPLAAALTGYFSSGHFDGLDLLATAAGVGIACVASAALEQRQ